MSILATSVAEFCLVKKQHSNNVKGFMIYVKIIKHAKFYYILIQFQLLPCAPAWDYKFHALAVYLHPTFVASFQSELHIESSRTSVVELFAEIVDVLRPLAIFGEELHRGYLTGFYMRLCPIIYYSLQEV